MTKRRVCCVFEGWQVKRSELGMLTSRVGINGKTLGWSRFFTMGENQDRMGGADPRETAQARPPFSCSCCHLWLVSLFFSPLCLPCHLAEGHLQRRGGGGAHPVQPIQAERGRGVASASQVRSSLLRCPLLPDPWRGGEAVP